MKRLFFASALSLALLVTGCSQPNVPSDAIGSSDQPIGTVAPKNTEAPTAKDEKAYYGNWTIKACAGTSQVYALSQDEIDGYIGTVLTYGKDALLLNGEEIKINGYEEEVQSVADFAADFKVQASSLGVTGEQVTAVSVKQEGDFFGNRFYLLNDNTLLLYHDGVFFQAVRK